MSGSQCQRFSFDSSGVEPRTLSFFKSLASEYNVNQRSAPLSSSALPQQYPRHSTYSIMKKCGLDAYWGHVRSTNQSNGPDCGTGMNSRIHAASKESSSESVSVDPCLPGKWAQ